MKANHQLINQTSGNTEWYSPIPLVNAGRRVVGHFDFDPATSYKANRMIVRATQFHTAPRYVPFGEINGLPVYQFIGGGLKASFWFGRVWMNHPFGNAESACTDGCTKKTCIKRGWHTADPLPGNADWIDRIVHEYTVGNVTEAVVLTFAATSENWFKPLKAFPQCYIDGRTHYLDPDTLEPVKQATKGSVVTYLGPNIDKFGREFSPFGAVMVNWLNVSEIAAERQFKVLEMLVTGKVE